MKKSIFATVIMTVCLSFFAPSLLQAQTIKVNNGYMISSLQADDNYSAYAGGIQIDYLKREWYYLSSEVAYLQRGFEAYHIGITQSSLKQKQKHKMNYLSVNTLFNVYKQIDVYSFYAGAGIRLDGLVSESNNADMGRNFLYGLKAIVGIDADLTESFLVGISAAYLPSFNNIIDSDLYKSDQAILFTFSVGYKF